MTATDHLSGLVEKAIGDGHIGIVVGSVVDDEITVAGAGHTEAQGLEPDRRTLFRIASLSKLFTGTALARSVVRGEFALEQSLRDAVPDWFALSAEPFDTIRLEHLATHSSGLPGGLNTDPCCDINEYVRMLAGTMPVSRPGLTYAYSNLGAQLVGMALTHGTELAFDALLYATGLGLPDIVERPDAEQRTRVAPGHDENGERCDTPTYPMGVASGGLYGSAEALLDFARTHWTCSNPELAAALRLAITPRAVALNGNHVGLFWHIGDTANGNGQRAVWHNGSLPGYRSFLAIRPDRRHGVVVLSNTARPVDALGARLLASLGG